MSTDFYEIYTKVTKLDRDKKPSCCYALNYTQKTTNIKIIETNQECETTHRKIVYE